MLISRLSEAATLAVGLVRTIHSEISKMTREHLSAANKELSLTARALTEYLSARLRAADCALRRVSRECTRKARDCEEAKAEAHILRVRLRNTESELTALRADNDVLVATNRELRAKLSDIETCKVTDRSMKRNLLSLWRILSSQQRYFVLHVLVTTFLFGSHRNTMATTVPSARASSRASAGSNRSSACSARGARASSAWTVWSTRMRAGCAAAGAGGSREDSDGFREDSDRFREDSEGFREDMGDAIDRCTLCDNVELSGALGLHFAG
eukprot:191358_1